KYGDNAFAAGRRSLGGAARAADGAAINLVDAGRAKHILYGDATGGGHKWGISPRLFGSLIAVGGNFVPGGEDKRCSGEWIRRRGVTCAGIRAAWSGPASGMRT